MNKNFQETASLSIVLSLLIRKLAQNTIVTTTSKFNFKKCFSHSLQASLFAKMSGSGFGHFRYAANEFYSKIFFTVYSRLLNLQYKFTVQRVIEASFFEVTTSRSCEAVNGFHNVTFGPGGKAIIPCSVFR